MGDSGEGLIDAEGRIQERMEELQREREQKQGRRVFNPELQRAVESLKLARTELEQQLKSTSHTGRKTQLTKALEEINRRISKETAKQT